jgi:hypothetical protein
VASAVTPGITSVWPFSTTPIPWIPFALITAWKPVGRFCKISVGVGVEVVLGVRVMVGVDVRVGAGEGVSVGVGGTGARPQLLIRAETRMVRKQA